MEDSIQKFCSKCGAELINGACPKCSQAQGDPQQSTEQRNDDGEKFKRFFMNPKERFVCALGNGYIQNFLADGYVGKGFAVVSDKRVYFNGKSYEVIGKRLKATSESRTVDLKDVTGTGVRAVKYPLLWIISIVMVLLPIVVSLVTISNNNDIDGFGEILTLNILVLIPVTLILSGVFYLPFFLTKRKGFLIPAVIITILGVVILFFSSIGFGGGSSSAIISILVYVPSIVLLISYFTSRKSLLTISYAGGCIAFDINWYPKEESDEFQRMLRIAKDKAVEDSENATANAMREVVSAVVGQPSVQDRQPQAAVSTADELVKYAQLYKDGLLSEEEFAAIKAKML